MHRFYLKLGWFCYLNEVLFYDFAEVVAWSRSSSVRWVIPARPNPSCRLCFSGVLSFSPIFPFFPTPRAHCSCCHPSPTQSPIRHGVRVPGHGGAASGSDCWRHRAGAPNGPGNLHENRELHHHDGSPDWSLVFLDHHSQIFLGSALKIIWRNIQSINQLPSDVPW